MQKNDVTKARIYWRIFFEAMFPQFYVFKKNSVSIRDRKGFHRALERAPVPEFIKILNWPLERAK